MPKKQQDRTSIPSQKKTVINSANPLELKKLKTTLGIIIAVFAFLLYAQSISYKYVYDDSTVLKENKLTTKGIASIPTLMKTDYWYGYKDDLRGPIYRPASLIMLAIEWQIFPNSPHIYHFVNVLLFALTCWLLFLLLCKLFTKQNLLFPFVCSLLYAAHPIHTEVVDNIKSRDEILCFLFGILALFLILKYVSDKSILYLFFGGISFFLSLLSKETGIAFLIILPLILFAFTDSTNKNSMLISFLLLVIAAVYFIIRMEVLKSIRMNVSDSYLFNSLVSAPDFISREATAFYVLLRYILLLIVPHPLSCDYNFSQIKIHALTDSSALLGVIVNFGIGIYAVINIRKKSIIALGILFYLITLAPVSNVFLLIGNTMAERFMYTPSLGFCMVIAYLIIKFTKTESIKSNFHNLSQFFSFNSTLFIGVFILIGLYSIKTVARNMDWKDDATLFSKAAEVSENSVTAHQYYGNSILNEVYPKEKDSIKKNAYLETAINELQKSLRIYPRFDVYRDLATCYSIKKEYETSIQYLQIVIHIDKDADTNDSRNLSSAFYNLGLQYNQSNQYDKALNIFDSALKYQPDFSLAYNNKGVAYLNQWKNTEALLEFKKAIQTDSLNQKAYTNMGCAYSNLQQYAKAFEYFDKAVKMDTADSQPFYFMGITYQNIGDSLKAKAYFEKASNMQNKNQK